MHTHNTTAKLAGNAAWVGVGDQTGAHRGNTLCLLELEVVDLNQRELVEYKTAGRGRLICVYRSLGCSWFTQLVMLQHGAELTVLCLGWFQTLLHKTLLHSCQLFNTLGWLTSVKTANVHTWPTAACRAAAFSNVWHVLSGLANPQVAPNWLRVCCWCSWVCVSSLFTGWVDGFTSVL